MIPLAEWKPDLADYKNDGATEARNVFYAQNSYKPIRGLTTFSSALTERVIGFTPGKQNNGTTYDFAGTKTYLSRLLNDGTWDNVSIAGNYATTDGEYWRFTQWGDDILATNFTNNIQKYTLGTSTDFSNLTTAVKARYIAAAIDFVFVGNTYDGTDGNVPNRVRWCAIGDPTDWTVSSVTQADYQDLDVSKGWIQGIVGGDSPYVFQERAISRFRYVGSPTVWAVDIIDPERGCYIPNSIVPVGNRIFFIAEDGFYMFDGANAIPIGENKVDKTFFADLHETYKDRISATIDPINKLVIWAYPSTASTGILDKQIIYNWVENKWSYMAVNIEWLCRSTSLGYTLEGLDALYSSIDAMTISLDSRVWMGGAHSLTAFDASHRMSYFNGSQLPAVIETGDEEINTGQRTLLKRIRPIADGTLTVQIGTRNGPQDTVTWGSAVSPMSNGDCPVLSNAMYHRVRINSTAGLSHAQGFDVLEQSPAGRF